MAYTINLTNGSVLTTVADATINTTATSLTLIGRNYPRYGEIQNENFVKLLENFADTSAPNNRITGQLWYDSNGAISRLKVYDGSNWKEVGGAIVNSSSPSFAKDGEFWVNTNTGQLYVKTTSNSTATTDTGAKASAFRLIGPLADPGEGKNGFVYESDRWGGNKVVCMYVNDELVAVFNKNPDFSSTVTGFSTVKTGVTLNSSLGAKFGGEATSASSVSSGAISGYLRDDADDSTTGTLSIANNGGLFVGTTSQFNIGVSSGNVTLRNSVNSGKIYLSTRNSSGTDANVVTVQNGTGFVGILVDPPTVPLDVNGVIRSNSELRAASNTGVSVGTSQQGYLGVESNNVVLRNTYPNAQIVLRTVVGSSNTDVIKVDPQGDSGSLWTSINSKVVPALNNAFDFGSTTLRWANLYAQNANINGTLTVSSISSSGALSGPSVTKTGTTGSGDIGQSTNRFGTVYATTFNGTANQAQYADLAEKYLADAEYEVGTVVAVGGEKEITAASAGDRALGVVSGKPAYLMNNDLEGGTAVALKGRVPVKVVGAVKKGQRLVAAGEGTAVAGSGWDVFAIALESNDELGVKLVEAVIL